MIGKINLMEEAPASGLKVATNLKNPL